jgi:hypothetical protein
MKFPVLIILFSLLLSACGNGEPDNPRTDFGSNSDFTVLSGVSAWEKRPTDCRAHIAKAICIVNPMSEEDDKNWESTVLNRECLEGGEAYVSVFEDVYDAFPTKLQKMFCSLRRVYVEVGLESTAYASSLEDSSGKSQGAVMGFRKSILDNNMSAQLWTSWKEQLNFGGELATSSKKINKELPHFSIKLEDNSIQDLIYMVVAHEFGHFFDFANKVNQFDDCKRSWGDEVCLATQDTWTSISWESNHKPLEIYDYDHRDELCFYSCKKTKKFISLDNADALYQGLFESNFITSYASTNPWDDFAESVAYIFMESEIGLKYKAKTPSGLQFNYRKKLLSDNYLEKRQYLDSFFANRSLQYP